MILSLTNPSNFVFLLTFFCYKYSATRIAYSFLIKIASNKINLNWARRQEKLFSFSVLYFVDFNRTVTCKLAVQKNIFYQQHFYSIKG